MGISSNKANVASPASTTNFGIVEIGLGLNVSNGVVSAAPDWSSIQNHPTTISGYGITDNPSHGIQEYLTPGTYTFVAQSTSAWITLIGGGGSGGNGNSSSISGGGGGSSGIKYRVPVTGITVGENITVTVGAGGTAVFNGSGNSGGTTSFGAYVSITGGGGGSWNHTGGTAGNGLGANTGATSSGSTVASGGAFVNWGTPGTIDDNIGGANATGYGTGGAGTWHYNSGNGKGGLCIVEW